MPKNAIWSKSSNLNCVEFVDWLVGWTFRFLWTLYQYPNSYPTHPTHLPSTSLGELGILETCALSDIWCMYSCVSIAETPVLAKIQLGCKSSTWCHWIPPPSQVIIHTKLVRDRLKNSSWSWNGSQSENIVHQNWTSQYISWSGTNASGNYFCKQCSMTCVAELLSLVQKCRKLQLAGGCVQEPIISIIDDKSITVQLMPTIQAAADNNQFFTSVLPLQIDIWGK